jgi:hypothetical protein
MNRPPLGVVLAAVLLLALGETAGAVMSQLRGPLERHARARVAADPATHGLSGSAEYDTEVIERTVFAVEAGLSFLHTHAQGLGLIVLLVGSVVASTVPWRVVRGTLLVLLTVGGFFPLGYLAYSVAVLNLGREAGIEAAERWLLIPLGSATVAALVGLLVALATARRRVPAA